jgi:hypothetical protein
METIERLRKRIELARAARDAEYEDKLVGVYIGLGEQLERALQRYGDKIAEAAAANNVRLLGELYEGLRQLRLTLIEWRLVAEELGIFSRASAIGSVGGGDGCCCPSPVAASFEAGGDADASDPE